MRSASGKRDRSRSVPAAGGVVGDRRLARTGDQELDPHPGHAGDGAQFDPFRAAADGFDPVPEAIDKEIAKLKLAGMGVAIDTLTAEQRKYLASWEMGT